MTPEYLQQSIDKCKMTTLVFIISFIKDMPPLIEKVLYRYEFSVSPNIYMGMVGWTISVKIK